MTPFKICGISPLLWHIYICYIRRVEFDALSFKSVTPIQRTNIYYFIATIIFILLVIVKFLFLLEKNNFKLFSQRNFIDIGLKAVTHMHSN